MDSEESHINFSGIYLQLSLQMIFVLPFNLQRMSGLRERETIFFLLFPLDPCSWISGEL